MDALGSATEEKNMSIKELLTVVYSIKLTQSQRIKLARLGGPKWIREQIEKAKHDKAPQS